MVILLTFFTGGKIRCKPTNNNNKNKENNNKQKNNNNLVWSLESSQDNFGKLQKRLLLGKLEAVTLEQTVERKHALIL